jgi:chemotaxis receptor (MCP) glutamine deamidase CheD
MLLPDENISVKSGQPLFTLDQLSCLGYCYLMRRAYVARQFRGNRMALIEVQPGEAHATRDTQTRLASTAVGFGVVILLFDSTSNTFAMGNFLLPDSSVNIGQATKAPCTFIDTGVPHLLSLMLESRGMGESRDFSVYLIGGTDIDAAGGDFTLGTQNLQAVSDAFAKHNLEVTKSFTSGGLVRTVIAEVGSGKIIITTSGFDDIVI